MTECAVSGTGDGAFVGKISFLLRLGHVNAIHDAEHSVRCRTDGSASWSHAQGGLNFTEPPVNSRLPLPFAADQAAALLISLSGCCGFKGVT
jgi:hypothetical protein